MKDTVTSAYPPEGNTGVFFRDRTLDVIKGIGIILMVIGHSGSPFPWESAPASRHTVCFS